MKRLLLATLCMCATIAYAEPVLTCAAIKDAVGLLPGQQLTQAQLEKMLEEAKKSADEGVAVVGLQHLCGLGVPKNVERALEIWTATALNGGTMAAGLLYAFYTGSFGDTPDPEQATKWLKHGAMLGDADMQATLGAQFLTGKNVAQDISEAERWLLKSSAQGNTNAVPVLAGIYIEKKRHGEALVWLNMSALNGNATAQFLLGQLYYSGLGVVMNHSTAVKWWQASADQQYAPAQFNLGVAYVSGHGVSEDAVQALRWFRLAADQGNLQAQESLAWMYEYGIGIQQDKVVAFKWAKKFAEIGNPRAQVRLGWMYVEGFGVKQDAVEGVRLFRMAAEKNRLEAYVSLAIAYEYGLGLPVDLEKARTLRLKVRGKAYESRLVDSCAFMTEIPQSESRASQWTSLGLFTGADSLIPIAERFLAEHRPKDALCWYQRAADSGHTRGQSALGSAYLANSEIPMNPILGLYYLRLAAIQGDVSARTRLSKAYQKGDVVPKNVVAAYALNFATVFNPDELDSMLENYHPAVEDEMTTHQILLGKQLIRDMAVQDQYLIALDRATVQ